MLFFRRPQVLETLDHRHGLMLVGATATGKTAAVQCLVRALEMQQAEASSAGCPSTLRGGDALSTLAGTAEAADGTSTTCVNARDSSSSATNCGRTNNLSIASKGASRSTACICQRIFPKALQVEDLYGSFDATTREWRGGALEQAVREASLEGNETVRRWIVLDGPVDVVRHTPRTITRL